MMASTTTSGPARKGPDLNDRLKAKTMPGWGEETDSAHPTSPVKPSKGLDENDLLKLGRLPGFGENVDPVHVGPAPTSKPRPIDHTEAARTKLLEALALDDPRPGLLALFEHASLAGVASCPALLEKLRGKPRCSGMVDRLERASRDAARREAREHAPEPAALTVRQAFDAPDTWPDYPMPGGYTVSEAGVLEDSDGVAVAHAPIAVVGSRTAIDADRQALVLGYRLGGSWRTITVPRAQAMDARAIVALADLGVPVSSVTARPLIAWLTACEATGGVWIPRRDCTSRLGWHGDAYVAGPGSDPELEDPDGTRAGWGEKGTWDGWRSAMRTVEREAVPWVVLYAACAAPLLRWMEPRHCPIIDLSGPSGRGKTGCLRVAASAWGMPLEASQGGTIVTWDATTTALERTAERTWDAPLLLDDTRRARRPEDVGLALYLLAQGRGKARGTPGGMQRTPTWRNVVISTGEAPVVTHTEAGGARNRVLSIVRTPALPSRDVAQRLEAALVQHHGHLGARVAERALALGSKLRDRYTAKLAEWGKAVPGADTRILSTAAAIEVGASVADDVGVPRPTADWRGLLLESVGASVEAADQGGRALDLVREELSRHRQAYHGQGIARRITDEPTAMGGTWRGVWRDGDPFVGLYPSTLREVLQGHDLEPVLARWSEAGVLVCGSHGRQRDVRIGKEKHRIYAFARSAVLDWADEDTTAEAA